MAYDAELAERLRELLADQPGLVEKPMFGGLAFLVGGHLAVSASSSGGLLVRVDPAQTETLLAEREVRPFVMRGREMPGWLRVDVDAAVSEQELRRWVGHGVDYAASLPPT